MRSSIPHSRRFTPRAIVGTAKAVLLGALVALVSISPPAVADDGPMVRHPVSRTPDLESEQAQMSMFQFYVDATARDGTLVLLEYFADWDADNQPDELVETREYAKPLLATYWDEAEWEGSGYDITTGDEVGPNNKRDTFGAISFDDGKTWKEENLSESALESSFDLENGIVFPGDVQRVTHSIAGKYILVAWVSKYCDQGSPRYSIKDELDQDGDGDIEEKLYPDLFDVAGNQKSIDYTEWMHHGEYPFAHIGEIPFSCVWTARGSIEYLPHPTTGVPRWTVLWRKAERLTSGKRDAFYLAIDGVEGAGFALAWQEDPEGLRPGYGEGPGEGWSGATVNHKTDIWYSFITWDDFPVMQDDLGNPTLDPSIIESNKPKVFNQMSMPSRLTDNYNCLVDRVDQDGLPHPPYCFEDFDGSGVADLCAGEFQFTNEQGELQRQCVTEDGRLMNGQIGSSRARMSLEGFNRADGSKSAWVIIAYEETKGLGAGHTEEGEEEVEALDDGKDVMYHSFEFSDPEIAAPGHMLNMPETDPTSDPLNPVLKPFILNDYAEEQYQTSFSRRPSLMTQPGGKIAAMHTAGEAVGKTSAIILYKEGTLNQGGPADVFSRRFIIPPGFDPTTDNPYAVENIECALWDSAIPTTSPSAYPPSAYPNGVCLKGAPNLSGVTSLTFEALDNADDGELPSHGITDRVLTFEQTPDNLDDESWVNPWDVGKGHRGFIDGDFVFVMYAWSPNWLMTSHGHEPYNLYIRRSFDGGTTWTTTPASFGGDGATYTSSTASATAPSSGRSRSDPASSSRRATSR